MKTAIKLVLIYFLMQILAAMAVGPVSILYVYFTYGTLDPSRAGEIATAPTLLLGFVFMTLYLWRKKYLTADGHRYSPLSLSWLTWSALAGISAIFLIGALMSLLTFLPNWLNETFDVLQSGWIGILSVSLLGPVFEELLFRGAVTDVLLKKYSPAKAIVFSGLIFGIFHLNPVQVVSASLVGFLLAWIYYKTRSLIPCILIHVLNNSLSVYLSLKYPWLEEDLDFYTTPAMIVGLVVAVLLLFLSLKKLNRYRITDNNTDITIEL